MRRLITTFFVLTVGVFAAKNQSPLQYGKVLAQGVETTRAGAYAAPIGAGAIAVPLYRRSNQVTIETDQFIYNWVELGRKTLILPVNGEITFWKDKNVFIVLDDQAHKHRFAVVGMTAKTQ